MDGNKLLATLWGSFVGDALSLSSHWVYNPKKIERDFGRITEILSPQSNKYHSNKSLGDFTHYGDQALLLLRSLAETAGAFDLDVFKKIWETSWDDYPGYIDGATKATLENLAAGAANDSAASGSNDLAGASRIAPIIFSSIANGDSSSVIESAMRQTAFSHGDMQVVESAQFFTSLAIDLVSGSDIASSLTKACSIDYKHLPVNEWGRESAWGK